MADAEELGRRKAALIRAYQEVHPLLTEILYEEDAVPSLSYGDPTEFSGEAGVIIPLLRYERSIAAVRDLIHKTFVSWNDKRMAGAPERYQVIAERVWNEVMPLLEPEIREMDGLEVAEAESIRRKRANLHRSYVEGHARLSDILSAADPVRTKLRDDYEKLARLIRPRLRDAHSVDEVRLTVHEAVVKQFGRQIAGPPESYQLIAERLWQEVMPLFRT